jgi:hypothetical protein
MGSGVQCFSAFQSLSSFSSCFSFIVLSMGFLVSGRFSVDLLGPMLQQSC